jgi:ATP synthase protein I
MQSSDARILRGAAIPTGLVGLAAILLSLLIAGPKGGLGAASGSLIVIAFFAVSVLAVSYASKISPQTMMLAAVLSYTVKLLGLMLLLAALDDVAMWNSKAFAWTVIVLTLTWIGAEIRVFTKVKMLYVDPADAPENQVDRSA